MAQEEEEDDDYYVQTQQQQQNTSNPQNGKKNETKIENSIDIREANKQAQNRTTIVLPLLT